MTFRKSSLFVLVAAIGLLSAHAFAVVPIKGNSVHGIGDGSGSWNVTGSFLGVSTTSLAYNTLFSGSQQSAQVYSLGNSIYEQLGCSSNSSCNVGDGTAVDFMFQVPISQIQSSMVTFTNFTGTVAALEIESCDGPTQFNGNPGPGYLCTTYPSGTGNLSVAACTSGSNLTFTLSGSLTSLGSVTFLLQYPNTAASLSAPVLATTPQPCASAPPVLVDFVAIDSPLANTPCFNCVNGTTSGTFGLTSPHVYIPTTLSTMQLVLYYEDNSYTGSCQLSFKIKQGTKVIAGVSKSFTGFTPNTVGYLWRHLARPAITGSATLTGSLTCGSNPAVTVTGPLYFP